MITPEDSPQVAPSAAPRADADDATIDAAARPALLDLRAQWSKLTSDQKLRAKQLGVVSTIALLGLALYTASSSGKKEAPKAPQASNLDMGAGLRGDSLEVKLRGDLQKILDGQTLLGDRVTAIEEGKVVPGTGAHPTTSGDGGDLPPAIPGDAPKYPPAPPEARSAADEIPAPPVAPSAPPAPPAPPTQRQVGAIGAATAAQAPEGGAGSSPSSKKGKRTIYLPPGFMKARLLTGIDALASRDATSNPEPIIARVQAPAVLPNEVKANLAGCFVIGNATGSLAKERVEIQLVSISCVDFESHAVVDQAIKGFFVDADGKKGLSGKVVTRAGATLARSFIAGTIAGISQTVEGSFGSLSTSALGSVRSLDAGDAVKSGVAGGLSKSSDKLTDFYLDLARQAGPVVEVGAAKDVVVVIQEGLALEIKPSVGSKF
ncbi:MULTISPECIES: TraB/VirB10 family protein [unclassified Novosphingobium]|uniref:TraB/VirB10 family protein n=1 Tax=unclassified Novosphingobium TaxID=2644732 RepID=UPI00146F6C21|nr:MULTISPECIES: TraB/VirB10 family protein [unclassified Novosphingobium]NMN06771.1 conjugal transfer pilus assembly protein TraB [Novosphingobium sp. SG919]NMN88778.1 conjugal transfer pilus assembly protein TraB [Novosphingobium sp. SG916]